MMDAAIRRLIETNESASLARQLGDLKLGTAFHRGNPGEGWFPTDIQEEGLTLCVRPATGKTERISNGERVYLYRTAP